MEKFIGFLRLTRPANLVTAVSDILAGVALAGYAAGGWPPFSPALLSFIIATICLYGGGVVMNDVFDAELDSVERPERPIPSGLIPRAQASLFGLALLAFGAATAAQVNIFPAGVLAVAIAVAALVYDKYAKHHTVLGPLTMGVCRGLNLLLGMSIVPAALGHQVYLALVPIAYIAAITMISQGEVHGGERSTLRIAMALYGLVMACLLAVAFMNHQLALAAVFVAVLALITFPPLVKALKEPVGKNIGGAVKAGVLALIIMNAVWVAAAGAWPLAILTALLLPMSILLARVFAVT